MPRLSTPEMVRLGILNGKIMGQSLREYNKIAVLSQLGTQCLATSSSLISTFETITGGVAKFFPLSAEELKSTVQGVLDFQPQAMVIIVGGAERIEECEKFFRSVLEAFAEKTLKADIILCLRGYLSGCLADITRANVSILSYIELLKYLRYWSMLGYDVDLDSMVLKLGRLTVSDGQVGFEEIAEYPLSAEHYMLLKRLVNP